MKTKTYMYSGFHIQWLSQAYLSLEERDFQIVTSRPADLAWQTQSLS